MTVASLGEEQLFVSGQKSYSLWRRFEGIGKAKKFLKLCQVQGMNTARGIESDQTTAAQAIYLLVL